MSVHAVRFLAVDAVEKAQSGPPGPVVYAKLGFTPENVADHVRRLVKP